jgi:hypothetical protein
MKSRGAISAVSIEDCPREKKKEKGRQRERERGGEGYIATDPKNFCLASTLARSELGRACERVKFNGFANVGKLGYVSIAHFL